MTNRLTNGLAGEADSMVTFQTAEGSELRGTLTDLNPERVVFEIYHPSPVIRNSEVLTGLKISINDQPVYHGRGVVRSLVQTGVAVLCEVTLSDPWLESDLAALVHAREGLRAQYDQFLDRWQKFYRVLPEVKILIEDMHSFLDHLRLWVGHIELGIRGTPSGDRSQLEHEVVAELHKSLGPTLNALFEKFEVVAAAIESGVQAAHHSYIKRQLHPLLLCSPFAYRTFQKPLGYAGDYEMVNMILRNGPEGGSLFAKLLHVWFVSQPPAEAHRNRVRYLTEKIIGEVARTSSQDRRTRIYNLGCGPAGEIQNFFLMHPELARKVEFVLVDFNDETLQYAKETLEGIKRQKNLDTPIQLVKKSVGQLLKAAHRTTESAAGGQYDLVYCAGLLDYLSDRMSKELLNLLYDSLAPEGLLIATNVDASNPIQHMLDYVLEWHLVYRTGPQLLNLRPAKSEIDLSNVRADITGVNVMLEVRKPAR